MGTMLFGLAVLVLVLLAAQAFTRANPGKLAENVLLGGALLSAAIAMGALLIGRSGLSLPLLLLAATLFNRFRQQKRATPMPGRASRVRSAMLEMELDHDSGALRGIVLTGAYKDRDLDALTPEDLKVLWRECARDGESRALLEAYLDRRVPGWRADGEADRDAGTHGGGAASTGPMSQEEAYQILGLQPGQGTEEIVRAHRALMKKLHPDHGGSTYLAARVNEAKEVLLRAHR